MRELAVPETAVEGEKAAPRSQSNGSSLQCNETAGAGTDPGLCQGELRPAGGIGRWSICAPSRCNRLTSNDSDRLNCGAGNDTLNGGAGNNILNGGTGA